MAKLHLAGKVFEMPTMQQIMDKVDEELLEMCLADRGEYSPPAGIGYWLTPKEDPGDDSSDSA